MRVLESVSPLGYPWLLILPRLLIHVIVCLPLSALLVYSVNVLYGTLFFLSSVLIDVDHFVTYYFLMRKWSWNPKLQFEYVSKWWSEMRPDDPTICWLFLHKLELWVLVAYLFPFPFKFVGLGALSNLVMDLLQLPRRIKYMTIATGLPRLSKLIEWNLS